MKLDHLVAELWYPRLKRSGSGMMVANGWILTAHHVVAKHHQASVSDDLVEVRLQGDWLANDKHWYHYQIYWSSPDLDIALLRKDPSEEAGATKTASLHFGKLERNANYKDCQCIGFPRCNKADDQSDTVSVRGNIDTASSQRQAHRVDMVLANRNLKQEEDWKGLSGGVVLYQGHVIGVAVDVLDQYTGNVMKVCPIEALYKVPGFDGINFEGPHLSPIESIGAAAKPSATDRQLKSKLPDLVCFLDRSDHVDAFKSMLTALKNHHTGRRSFVCAIVGEQKHEHYALVQRLDKEILPSIFADEPGYEICPLEFRANFSNVDAAFAKLKKTLLSKLTITDPNGLVDAFNSGATPRIFYMFVYGEKFGTAQKELLTRWAKFWLDIKQQDLTCVVGLVICFCNDEKPHSEPSKPWWKIWGKSDKPELETFSLDDVDADCETMELDFCRPHHIDEWIAYLEASSYEWSVEYIRPLAHNFYQKNEFSVRDVKTVIGSDQN